jgi:hypothetical protein
MNSSNFYGILPRRWSDGQDSMQFAGFLKLGQLGPALNPSFRGRRWGDHAKQGKTGRDLIVIQEALVDCFSEPLTTSIPADSVRGVRSREDAGLLQRRQGADGRREVCRMQVVQRFLSSNDFSPAGSLHRFSPSERSFFFRAFGGSGS